MWCVLPRILVEFFRSRHVECSKFSIVRRLLFYLTLLGVFCGLVRSSRADDAQFWQWATIDLHKNENWRLYLYADNRIGDDVSDAYLQILSPRVKWSAHENFDFGLGYAWLNINPLLGGEEFWQHRAEFEFNPKFTTGPWSFHNRNRMELRWNNGEGKRRPRLRNRLQVKYRLDKGLAPLTYLYVNNEFFFDLSVGRFSENRLVPLGIGFKLTENTTLNLFYMRQSIQGRNDWRHANVAGTFLQVEF